MNSFERPEPNLKPEIKAKWLAALRSGKYRQAKEHLKNDEGYCCLGVLACELGYQVKDYGCAYYFSFRQYEESRTELPDIVLNELGLPDWVQDLLIRYNDIDNWTFSQIADWIEENL